MRDNQAPKAIYLKDYQVPPYLIETTELSVKLYDDHALVEGELACKINPDTELKNPPLELHGVDLELLGIEVDGRPLEEEDYVVAGEVLTIHRVPERFSLHTKVRIKPQENTSLEGLYVSKGMFCTQCEAEGFRKITYFLDRPDVMSVFTTRVEADKSRYPVLLSNGNPIDQGEVDGNRHFVTWNDPFKKPAYLFALVAGDLSCVEDHFTTVSGRDIKLQIFVEPHDLDKCDHAMESLKNSMKWDEEVFGREYDLDIYMIVAVSHFNMGAMENKGLNIFNTSCVLANPKTTSDAGFQRVEAVIAHEYFHNWSGNRVTCRDWFQLSLKEGFTVFRDQEFSSDMGSRTVQRVENVNMLRTVQFAEDAGPMAHPVRPDSFIEINNFYTVTIYEKGSEVVRMIHTLVGPEGFRKGTDLYFKRHDGQAVTTEDFVEAMEDANDIDLGQFQRWYSQAGTPVLHIEGSFDESKKQFCLKVKQSCAPTPGQQSKLPFHIPLKLGLLNSAGADMSLKLEGAQADKLRGDVLSITNEEEVFVFQDIEETPIPSLGRGFSAPVKLNYPYTKEQLAFLMANDNDGFNRWDAGNRLATGVLLEGVKSESAQLDEILLRAFRSVLISEDLDHASKALLLALPSEAYLGQQMVPCDVDGIHDVRKTVQKQLSTALASEWLATFKTLSGIQEYQPKAEDVGKRSLKNLALSYLMALESDEAVELCLDQYNQANNMTDQGAAFRLLVHSSREEKQQVIQDFYSQWQDEALVVDQWFMIQATSPQPGTLDSVKQLMQHDAFEITNPNKVRAVIGAFCNNNPIHYHALDGSGYAFLADQVIQLNKLNPQIAARLMGAITRWKQFDQQRQDLMVTQIKRIMAEPDLSPDVYEVASKSLQ